MRRVTLDRMAVEDVGSIHNVWRRLSMTNWRASTGPFRFTR